MGLHQRTDHIATAFEIRGIELRKRLRHTFRLPYPGHDFARRRTFTGGKAPQCQRCAQQANECPPIQCGCQRRELRRQFLQLSEALRFRREFLQGAPEFRSPRRPEPIPQRVECLILPAQR